MKESIDHWLDSFRMFHNKYIIMPTESYNSLFPEGSRYITVRSPPYFIHRENETRRYSNITIKLLYCNVIFRPLILNIDCYNIMIGLYLKKNICPSLPQDHDCEIVTEIFGRIYLWGRGGINTDGFNIIANVRVDYQVDSAEFEALLYTIFS